MTSAPRRTRTLTKTIALAAMASVSLPMLPAAAQTVTITDLSSPEGDFRVVVPTLELEDANISEAELRALFAGNPSALADKISTLNATAIRIPELSVEFSAPDENGTLTTVRVVYNDFEIDNIANGVAQSSTLSGGEIDDDSGVTFTLGQASTGTVDLGLLFAFYGLSSAPATTEMRPVYADFVFEGAKMSAPNFSCDFGPISVDEVRARPLKVAYSDLLAAIKTVEEAGSDTMPPPETLKTLVTYYVDLFEAFESSPMTFEGFDCSGTDEEGRAVSVASGGVDFGSYTPGLYPAVSFNDFNVTVEDDGFFSLGNMTIKPIDFNKVLAVFKDPAASFDEAWFEANARKFIPDIEGISFSDFAVDIPDETNPGQRIKAQLGAFDLALADYINGIPTNIASSATNLVVDVPPGAGAEAGIDLAALGFEQLNLNYDLKAHWNPADNTIDLENVAIDGDNLGAVTFSATLGNATDLLFGEDVEAAQMAAMGLTVRSVTIDVKDAGLGPIVAAAAAQEQGAPVDQFRTQVAGIAQGTALAILGGTPEAEAVGRALGDFVKGAPNLNVKLTAKEADGVGLAEFMALQDDPTQLARFMDVEATSSGEPLPAVDLPSPPAPAASAPADGAGKANDKN